MANGQFLKSFEIRKKRKVKKKEDRIHAQIPIAYERDYTQVCEVLKFGKKNTRNQKKLLEGKIDTLKSNKEDLDATNNNTNPEINKIDRMNRTQKVCLNPKKISFHKTSQSFNKSYNSYISSNSHQSPQKASLFLNKKKPTKILGNLAEIKKLDEEKERMEESKKRHEEYIEEMAKGLQDFTSFGMERDHREKKRGDLYWREFYQKAKEPEESEKLETKEYYKQEMKKVEAEIGTKVVKYAKPNFLK